MRNKSRKLLITGSIVCAFAVVIGAFGAHGLKTVLIENESTDTFRTGVLYHIFHGLGLIGVGLIYQKINTKFIALAGWVFLVGILLFSGSLYLQAVTRLTVFGPITPIGGVFFILGWVLLAIGIKKADTIDVG